MYNARLVVALTAVILTVTVVHPTLNQETLTDWQSVPGLDVFYIKL